MTTHVWSFTEVKLFYIKCEYLVILLWACLAFKMKTSFYYRIKLWERQGQSVTLTEEAYKVLRFLKGW